MSLWQKPIFSTLILVFFLFPGLACAASAPAGIGTADTARTGPRPGIVLLYVNNAKTTYDGEINKKMTNNFATLLQQYELIPGQLHVEKLTGNGTGDIALVERGAIAEVCKGEAADFALVVEVQPFIRKERLTFSPYGTDITAVMSVKLIDLKGNKYLINGQFNATAKDSSAIGSIGNKALALKSLDLAIEQLNPAIATRLVTREEAKPENRPGIR